MATVKSAHKKYHQNYQAKFVELQYSNVELKRGATSANHLSSSGESSPAVLYVNKALSDRSRIIFLIEDKKMPLEEKPLVCKVGLTTCKQADLKKHHFHVTDVCTDGKMACQGYSLCISIYLHNVIAVVLETHPNKGGIALLSTSFTNQTKTTTLKDRTEGSKMTAVPLYPFIILNGLASRVRVIEEYTSPLEYLKQLKTPPKVKEPAKVKVDNEKSTKLLLRSSWLWGSGINLDCGQFTRQPSGSHFFVCKEALSDGQEYVFKINQVDSSNREETFSLGYAVCNISDALDAGSSDDLPDGWKVYPSVFPSSPKQGDEVRIRVNNLTVNISSKEFAARQVFRDFSQDARLFIKMTPNLMAIELGDAPKSKEKVKQDRQEEGTCVICLDAKSTYLLPCDHLCLCATCFREHTSCSEKPQCPMCRKEITSHKVIFLS